MTPLLAAPASVAPFALPAFQRYIYAPASLTFLLLSLFLFIRTLIVPVCIPSSVYSSLFSSSLPRVYSIGWSNSILANNIVTTTTTIISHTCAPPSKDTTVQYIRIIVFTRLFLELTACGIRSEGTSNFLQIPRARSFNINYKFNADMLASRVAKPKLSLSISTANTAQSSRPALSLKSPMAPLKSPLSPMPNSPTALNTRLNQRGYSTMQQPTYSYVNSSSSRSILKKSSASSTPNSTSRRQLSFSETPVVYCVTPIDEPGYYGSHARASRDERRWQRN